MGLTLLIPFHTSVLIYQVAGAMETNDTFQIDKKTKRKKWANPMEFEVKLAVNMDLLLSLSLADSGC